MAGHDIHGRIYCVLVAARSWLKEIKKRLGAADVFYLRKKGTVVGEELEEEGG